MLFNMKFRWLLATSILVTLLEVFSLLGLHLPQSIAIPFFLTLIIGIGHETLYHGIKALLQLNFKSINLLMIIAVVGAFYLGRYEEAAVVIVLYTLAEKLEDMGIAKSKSAIADLTSQMPKMVMIKGDLLPISVNDVKLNDIMIVKPGEMIALDGEIVEGSSYVDESTITGEPIPKDKVVGDSVFAGTWNKQGYLEVRITKTSEDSTIAKIQEITFQATKNKAKTQRFIESFSEIYTPAVIILAIIIGIVPIVLWGVPFDQSLLSALTLIVIACPCALVISTPVSIYSAIGNASSKGVLIKGGRALESIGQVNVVAFDKTRTLTYGKPKVTDIIPFGKSTREHLLSCAAGIENKSEHPLALSILEAAAKENMTPHEVENFQSLIGKGAKADCLVCEDRHHCIGKLAFILEEHPVPEHVLAEVERLQNEGKTVILVSTNHAIEGLIGLSDELRPESKEVIATLDRMGISSVMLTGDHKVPAEVIAKEIGLKEVYADLLPEDKAEKIEKLISHYKSVAMVGDGVNDAPALALSSVGISMTKLGSDVAVEAASIVILNDHLRLIPSIINLGQRTLGVIKFNTFWAVFVKLIFVSLAVMGMSNLAMAIFADVGVTLLVIANSLRLMRDK